MEKTKKAPKIQNGEKTEVTRAELIKQTEAEIAEIVRMYDRKIGYLAGIKEGN